MTRLSLLLTRNPRESGDEVVWILMIALGARRPRGIRDTSWLICVPFAALPLLVCATRRGSVFVSAAAVSSDPDFGV